MCGIAGFIGLSKNYDPNFVAKKMSDRLIHRGPDSDGLWSVPEIGLGLAHRRLAIMDLSQEGHQPMHSKDGRYVIIYNGEIYNHLELRNSLNKTSADLSWRGHSDTETLLASISYWGLEETLKKCNGMFAISLWDNKDKKLYLCRDRSGEKPLYYGMIGGAFAFASELKALSEVPGWSNDINLNALHSFLNYSFVPAPHSIFSNIYKLLPGHYLSFDLSANKKISLKKYWTLSNFHLSNQDIKYGNDQETISRLDTLLKDSVLSRMASDVPLGAFLSGGVDSSIVVSMMQAQSSKPIQTFSIGFSEAGYNEAEHASLVAQHLGTDHTELHVSSSDAIEVIPKLSEIWNEPFADNSQIPTYLVSQLARKDVTVSLSGDGGDELFCGYNRYFHGYMAWKKITNLPSPIRNLTNKILSSFKYYPYNYFLSNLLNIFGKPALGNKLDKLIQVTKLSELDAYYKSTLSSNINIHQLLINNYTNTEELIWDETSVDFNNDMERMMFYDTLGYLPDNVLVKMDRASMAVSLEARVPLLDHRVIEFASMLPMNFKIRDNSSKWILKQVLYNYVPKNIIDRPKMGFSVPIDSWLKGPLRDWSVDLLNEEKIINQGLMNHEYINNILKMHLKGQGNFQQPLWNILMFQSWYDHWCR